MADERDPGKVKVIDRRWFTAEGELREGASAPPPAVAPAPAAAPAPADAPPRPDPPPSPPPAAEPAPEPAPASPEPGPVPPGPGISDLVDSESGEEDRPNWTPYAATAALAFARGVIEAVTQTNSGAAP